MRGVPEAFADVIRHPLQPGPNHPVRKLIGGAPCATVINSPEFDDPVIQNAYKLGGMRTGLFVPLRKDRALLGYIVAARPEIRPFSDKEVALLQNFAAQAVIAMENARLLTETREALEQQTATAEVLQVINSSPGDLAPVFDAMLEKAIRLCGGIQGALWTLDGERSNLAASRGNSPEFVAMLRERKDAELGPPEAVRLTICGERLLQIPDLVEHQLYRAGDPIARAAVELSGVRSLVGIGLVKDGAPAGAFMIGRREARPFTDKQIALLENFAAQAVIAMENARLITETREALEQQTATAEVLQVINSSPGDLAPVFDAILEKAHSLCGAAHGDLTLADGDNFRAVAMRGMPEAFAEVLRRSFPPRRGFHDRLLGGFVQIADLTAPEFSSDNPVHRAAIGPGAVRTLLAVPLRRDGRLLGYITANRQEVRPFSDKQIALLQNFAAQAVIAMENARLITETHEALEQQTATAEVLQVINSSPGDLAPVFDAMLEKATTLCGAAFGTLVTYDGERFAPAAAYGVPAAFANFRSERGAFDAPPGSSLERVVNGESLVHIANVAMDPGQAATPVGAIGWVPRPAVCCVAQRQ